MGGGAVGEMVSAMVSVMAAAHAGWEKYPRYAKRHGPSLVMQVVTYSGALVDVAGAEYPHYPSWYRWQQATFINSQCKKNNQDVVKHTCCR